MINRNVTRTILNATETTKETNSITTDALSFVVTTFDFFYMGFQGKFASRYFSFSTLNTNSTTLTVEFWNGTAWESVDDLVDQTVGFTQNGFISWVNKATWQASNQSPMDSDIKLFWIRMSVSANLSAGTSLQSVLNLFSDDTFLRYYYPEIVSDSRYLPPSRSDFIEQHVAAKDLVVLRLKQRRLIDEESDIIDINNVAVAAIHAAVMIILSPIAFSEETVALKTRAETAFNNELNQLSLGVDQDNDGIVSSAERKDVSYTSLVRR